MMNNRVCYRKIRTYTDLRIERMRVDREAGLAGRAAQGRLAGHFADVLDGLSRRPGHRSGEPQMYAFVQWGMSAYSHVRSIIEKHKAERSGQGSQDGR